MIRRSLLASCAFMAASALNPGYLVGCATGDDDDPGFEFGAKELAVLVMEANGTHLAEADGAQWRVELDIEPESKPTSASADPSAWSMAAHACGNRTFYATANACIDVASMPVQGTLKLTRLGTDTEKTYADTLVLGGELSVLGLKLTRAELRLRTADAAVELISSDGQSFDQVHVNVRH